MFLLSYDIDKCVFVCNIHSPSEFFEVISVYLLGSFVLNIPLKAVLEFLINVSMLVL